MTHSLLSLSRRRLAAVLFGAGALAVGACSSPSTEWWLGSGASSTQASYERPLTEPTAVFVFSPISYMGKNTEVTAINDESSIVGIFEKPSGQYSSFTAPCGNTANPYQICNPPTFSPVPYSPGPDDGTYLNANDNTDPQSLDAGYVISPPLTTGISCATCGALYDKNANGGTGIWEPLLQDPNEANSGPCAVTKLLGIGDPQIAVGYYEISTSSGCKMQAFEEYRTNGNREFVNFNVPGATSSIATGIDNGGDVVGTAIVPVGGLPIQEGWYYSEFKYTLFYVGDQMTSNTEPTDLNWVGLIVGNYTDSNGAHGFLAKIGSQLQTAPPYATIDDGSYGTFINSITASYRIIAGWYRTDTAGDTKGFVGSCQSGFCAAGSSIARLPAEARSVPKRPAALRP